MKSLMEKFTPLILKEASKWKIKCYNYEDLVQHGYLSVIKAYNLYKGDKRYFDYYCINAIKNNYKSLLKGEIKHHREIPQDKDIYSYEFTIEDELIAYEKIKDLYVALNVLTPDERRIIEGFYLQDKTMKEISRSSYKSYNNVRYLKDKALKKLRNKLCNLK